MERNFCGTLAALRRSRKISQRQAAAELGISQALLSHYENGAREPGLSFVCKACDYYGVTADYLLCRTETPGSIDLTASREFLARLRGLADSAETELDRIGGEQA